MKFAPCLACFVLGAAFVLMPPRDAGPAAAIAPAIADDAAPTPTPSPSPVAASGRGLFGRGGLFGGGKSHPASPSPAPSPSAIPTIEPTPTPAPAKSRRAKPTPAPVSTLPPTPAPIFTAPPLPTATPVRRRPVPLVTPAPLATSAPISASPQPPARPRPRPTTTPAVAPTLLPTAAPSLSVRTIRQALLEPDAVRAARQPIRQLASFGWLAGTWHGKDDTYVFAFTMKGRWLFGADGKSNDFLYISYDPLDDVYVLERIEGSPAYGLWTSPGGWQAGRIVFTSEIAYVAGRPYHRRLTIERHGPNAFTLREEEQLESGEWALDGSVELTKG